MPPASGRRLRMTISSALTTRVESAREFIDQPTILRLNVSRTAQQYSQPSRAWILSVVATRAVYACSSKAVNRSAGVSQPRVLRGRVLSCLATAWRSAMP